MGFGKRGRDTLAVDGSPNDNTLFCEMGSDGMTLDARGNVYLTGKGVTVFNSAGSKIAHFEIPEPWTANVRIGGRDNYFLFVTAGKAVYGAKLNVHGAR